MNDVEKQDPDGEMEENNEVEKDTEDEVENSREDQLTEDVMQQEGGETKVPKTLGDPYQPTTKERNIHRKRTYPLDPGARYV